ncbi:unnamed protein product [Prorocentrum cordatum]|uniref:EF-hand domain-containing protein n=1 Tax=Prorocentrum cordatum TaxID=2364126 RepID=A0ABN9QCI2_9DINO|nr:unnamed protein product [Polarella glacialis]
MQASQKQAALQLAELLHALERRLRGAPAAEGAGLAGSVGEPAEHSGQRLGTEVRFGGPHRQSRCSIETQTTADRVQKSLVHKIAEMREAFEDNYGSLPETNGMFARAIQSRWFELASGLIIILNTVYAITDANLTMELAIEGNADSGIHVAEAVFFGWFTMELILKLIAQGKYFFTAKPDVMWNYFDTFLWVMSFLLEVFSAAASINVSFLRVLRCLKLVRVIHMLHFLDFTKELRTMMESTIQSALTLLWCLLMVGFFVLLFALFFVQSASPVLASTDDSLTDAQRDAIIAYFGSVHVAARSLVMATTGGFDWEVLHGTLVPVGAHAVVTIYLRHFFILFFQIAIWNVVTSIRRIFVDKASQLAKPNAEEALQRKQRMENKDRQALRKMIEKCDINKDGRTNLEEFIRMISHSDFQCFLQDRGIEIKEAMGFFSMVTAAHGTDEIDFDALALSCLRSQGSATGIDLNTFRHETRIHLREITSSLADLRCTVDCLARAFASAAVEAKSEPDVINHIAGIRACGM